MKRLVLLAVVLVLFVTSPLTRVSAASPDWDRLLVSCSPNSEYVAYTIAPEIDFGAPRWIAVYDIVSKQEMQLTFGEELHQMPSISPDGKKVAFSTHSLEAGSREIAIVDIATRVVTLLTNTAQVYEDDPSWSPDGTHILYSAQPAGSSADLYIIKADGSESRALTNTPGIDESQASWSPDGQFIVYRANGDIFVMDADGSNQRQLTTDPDSDFSPNWSPSGRQISFTSARDGNFEIYIMNADGSDQRRVTVSDGLERTSCWVSELQLIVAQESPAGWNNLLVLDVEDGRIFPLVSSTRSLLF